TRREGSATGNMRSISAFITLKIAVLAPIPRARVRMAMQLMTGFFSSWRKANLRSFITQCLHRIDSRRFTGRQPAGENRHAHQQQGDCYECQWINRLALEQQT